MPGKTCLYLLLLSSPRRRGPRGITQLYPVYIYVMGPRLRSLHDWFRSGALVFMTGTPDQKTDFVQSLLRDTAKRLQRALPEGEISLAAFGPRPRMGQIFDRLQSGSLQNNAGPVSVGPYLFDSAGLALRDDSRVLRLTEKERDILLALLAAEGQRIERRDMLESVWGYASGVETHTLETHIYRLRQKMEIDPAKPVIVLTDGDGYRLA